MAKLCPKRFFLQKDKKTFCLHKMIDHHQRVRADVRYEFLWLKNLYFAFSTLTIVIVNWSFLDIVCCVLLLLFLFFFLALRKNCNNCRCHFSIKKYNNACSITKNANRFRYRQVKQMKMRLNSKSYKNSFLYLLTFLLFGLCFWHKFYIFCRFFFNLIFDSIFDKNLHSCLIPTFS